MSSPGQPERFFQSPQPIHIPETTPLVFLEGPVQGSPDWQTPFAHRLLDTIPDVAVASPRALPDHQANLQSDNTAVHEAALERQIDYEFLARRLAFRYGAIALWYAAQDPSLPYPEGRVYGKTSEKEDSEVWGRMFDYPEYPFVVGYEPGFRGRKPGDKDYGNRNHARLDIYEHSTLDDVFNATIEAVATARAAGLRPVHPLTSRSIQQVLDQLDSE